MPQVGEGIASVEWQLGQAEFFLQHMRGNETMFQRAFSADNVTKSRKERELFAYNFNAFLHSVRTAVYFMSACVKRNDDHRAWLSDRGRSAVSRAFMALRDSSTHKRPLRFSLTYQTQGMYEVPLHGLVSPNIKVDLSEFLEVRGPPMITVDPPDVSSTLRAEYMMYYTGDERRKSVIFMCEDYLGELRATVVLGEKRGAWRRS